MAFGLRQLGDSIDRFNHFHKVPELNGSVDPFAIRSQFPVRDGRPL
jgi:hypothetical protein